MELFDKFWNSVALLPFKHLQPKDGYYDILHHYGIYE